MIARRIVISLVGLLLIAQAAWSLPISGQQAAKLCNKYAGGFICTNSTCSEAFCNFCLKNRGAQEICYNVSCDATGCTYQSYTPILIPPNGPFPWQLPGVQAPRGGFSPR